MEISKNQVSLPAYTALKGLSKCFSDPSGALSLLKSDMKTRISVIKLRTHVEYIGHLIAAKVGTEDAERNAIKFVYGGINTWGGKGDEVNKLRSKGVIEEVMRTMKVWERKESKALREKVTEVERHCYSTSENLWRIGMTRREEGTPEQFLTSILSRYEREVLKEEARQEEASREAYREKARWRIKKVRKGEESGEKVDERWRGVLVSDKQLEQEENRMEPSSANFILLDKITMDEDEQEYMNLTYKFREIEPMSFEKLENEVEIHSVNLRYELMDHIGEDDEYEDDMTEEEIREWVTSRGLEWSVPTQQQQAEAVAQQEQTAVVVVLGGDMAEEEHLANLRALEEVDARLAEAEKADKKKAKDAKKAARKAEKKAAKKAARKAEKKAARKAARKAKKDAKKARKSQFLPNSAL